MATVTVLVYMNKRNAGDSGFQVLHDDYVFSRVPTVGEIFNLGNDTADISADYRVLVVHHLPIGGIGKRDAEIYAERVFLPTILIAAKPEAVADDAECVPKGEAIGTESAAAPTSNNNIDLYLADLTFGRVSRQKDFAALSGPDDALEEAKTWLSEAAKQYIEEHEPELTPGSIVGSITAVLVDEGPAESPTAMLVVRSEDGDLDWE